MLRIITSVFCLSLTFATFAQSAEEEKIKLLLQKETDSFSQMSIADLIKTYWIMDAQTMMNVSFPDGNHLHYNLDALLSKTMPPSGGDGTKVEKYDYQFTIVNEVAFVTFSQKTTTGDGDYVYSHESRFLQKQGGEWKIHASSVHQYTPKGDRD
jgi:Rps23 Pro-64 3,4-dihydroxylase Tpa1-like proline 4-hydroxylase